MAKLYFYYSAMNAGKSTVLLQSSYNYNERNMDTLLLVPQIDNRYEVGKIASRIGLTGAAKAFSRDENLYEITVKENHSKKINCVLVDEAQFLTKQQVSQLCDITDGLNIPVLTYGLRSDFRGEPFEGSLYLLIWADSLIELKTICHCGKKATMNMRIDGNGNAVLSGEQIEIGGNDRYVSVCRRHHKERCGK